MRKNSFSEKFNEIGTIEEARQFFRLSRNLVTKLAKEHDCLIVISERTKRINIKKLQEILEREKTNAIGK